MPMMLTVLAITPNTKHIRNHPNHADNQPVRNLNRSNATRDRHNANPRHVKVLRSNARPNPNRDNRVSVAGTPLLEPPRPERLRPFGRIFTLLAFAASRRSHGHRGYKFSSVSRREQPRIQIAAPLRQARRHETTPLTGGFILPV